MEDIEDLLLQIEEELDNGKKSFFGSGVTVDAEVIVNIINRIRDNYPSAIQRATSSKKAAAPAASVARKNDYNLQDETQKASNIVMMAQQRAEQILSEHNIVYQAQREAETIKQRATEYREKIMSQIKSEVNDMLGEAQRNLSDALGMINDALKNNNQGVLPGQPKPQ
ncbi:MAG: hypothetical protein LBE09_06285 [Christensenellaceae bacterium]|jgi:uncharacterized coiled-coil DUF342 family protein|nr:hypothetical protein [Christensenellaceae bacterium]